MEAVYRLARIGDLQEVADVYRLSLADVYRRHGFEDQLTVPRGINPFYAFVLREEPEGFFVAEEAGRIVGATFSWVRGTFWFLSHLFIMPEYQGRGIGKELLERSLEYSAKSGATTRSVITMAFNPSSVSLYIRNGMYPVQDIFLMNSFERPEKEKDTAWGGGELSWEIAGPAAWRSEELNNIDTEVLGMNRPSHHRFFIEDQQARCLIFRSSGRAVAYAYIWRDGHIGPVAAVRDAPCETVIRTTIGLTWKYCSSISMMVPGSNRIALETAFSADFSVSLPYIMLSSQPFGAWDRYLALSPGMM
jgi:ribosomal protein S18 acetylase RimI-like enzyme